LILRLRPIPHRTVEQQQALTLILARELLVRLRTASINAVRGLTKACGHRMPASSTACFAQRGQAAMPPGLKLALGPILTQIAEMTLKIKQYDKDIQRLTQTEYVETQAMTRSATRHHQGWQRVSAKSPDRVREPHSATTWSRLGSTAVGLHLAARGGKQAKNKSVVAVARKLAVLLHHLWTTQQPYIRFFQQAA
jgi:transposase